MQVQLGAKQEGVTRAALAGRLDRSAMQEADITKFEAHIAGAKQNAIVDMTQVEILTSLGIRMLLETAKALKLASASMVLVGPSAQVLESLQMSGLVDDMPVAKDDAAAIALLGG
ncbi:MAG: anti-sigma factor antagonist [Desulfovibrio sp.]|nr:MAG: anti-sigma factor antagonist [Desulfovibrio sp.]